MSDELKEAIAKLKEAVQRLQEGLAEVKDQLDRDGVIQRFEFTFELLWKTLKLLLEELGLQTRSPRETFQAALRLELVLPKEESIILQMLKDRNQTVHTYDEKTAGKIFKNIKKMYLSFFENLLPRIQLKLEEIQD